MSNLSNIKLTPKQNLIAVLFILLIIAALGLRLHFSNKAYEIVGPIFIVSTDTTAAFVYNTYIYQLDDEGNILNKIPFKELGLKHKITDIQLLDNNRFVVGDWLNEVIILCEFRRRSCEPLTKDLGKHIRDFFMFHYQEESNELFISDTTNHRIVKYDVNAHQSIVLSKKGAFLYPNHLQIEQDGYLYIADSNHRRIAKFTYDKESLAQQGNDIQVPDEFSEQNWMSQWACKQSWVPDSGCKSIKFFFPDSKQDWLLHFARQQNGGLYVLAANYSLIDSDLVYFPASGEVEKITLPQDSEVTTFSIMKNKLLLNDKSLFKLYVLGGNNDEIKEFGSDELNAVFKKDFEQSYYWNLASDIMFILLLVTVIGMVLFILYLAKKGNKQPEVLGSKQDVENTLPPIVPGKLLWLSPNPVIRRSIPVFFILAIVMFGMFYGVFDLFGISTDKIETDAPILKLIQASALMLSMFILVFINMINNIYYKIGTDGIHIYINKIFNKITIQPQDIMYSDNYLLVGSLFVVYRNNMKHYFSDKNQFETYIAPLLKSHSKHVSRMGAFAHMFKNPSLLNIFNVFISAVLIYYMLKLGMVFG